MVRMAFSSISRCSASIVGIDGDHALAQLDVAIDQRLDGIGDLPLRKPAHLGDLAGDFLQIGVERLGGVVDLVVVVVISVMAVTRSGR